MHKQNDATKLALHHSAKELYPSLESPLVSCVDRSPLGALSAKNIQSWLRPRAAPYTQKRGTEGR